MGVASCFIWSIADVSRHSPALHSPASGDLIRFDAVARGRNNRIWRRETTPFESPPTIDADQASKTQAGGPDGMRTRAVLVAVRDCDFHGEQVAEAPEWGQYDRVCVT